MHVEAQVAVLRIPIKERREGVEAGLVVGQLLAMSFDDAKLVRPSEALSRTILFDKATQEPDGGLATVAAP